MFWILKGTLNLLEIHQNKNLFSQCSMVENSWAKPRKNFHISHFQSNCEIFENRFRLVELNFLKHQLDLTRKNSWWWSPKFKIKQDNLFLNKNAAINFWTSMSIGSNICITCITFTYTSFCKTFAKQKFSFAPLFGCIYINNIMLGQIHASQAYTSQAHTFAFASSWRTLVVQAYKFAFASS